jgi:hypothetical protein
MTYDHDPWGGLLRQIGEAADHALCDLWSSVQRNFNFFDLEQDFWEVFRRCRPFTFSTVERMYALYQATRHVVEKGIPGALVECGVFRGGSCMVVAHTLLSLGEEERPIYLYDTFEGMTPPGAQDRAGPRPAGVLHPGVGTPFNQEAWAPLEEVRRNVFGTGYPPDRFVFVRGPVEKTIPRTAPEEIALLRLDTDWYESTYHELRHLFPRLSPGGVLILDDYGLLQGCRQAVDRYLAETGAQLLLGRIDFAARYSIK